MSYSINVNKCIVKMSVENLIAFLKGGISDEAKMQFTKNKRLRSRYSQTSFKVKKLNNNFVAFQKGGISNEVEMQISNDKRQMIL